MSDDDDPPIFQNRILHDDDPTPFDEAKHLKWLRRSHKAKLEAVAESKASDRRLHEFDKLYRASIGDDNQAPTVFDDCPDAYDEIDRGYLVENVADSATRMLSLLLADINAGTHNGHLINAIIGDLENLQIGLTLTIETHRAHYTIHAENGYPKIFRLRE